ncbi:MAG: amino acid adenylation domain-containing protein [Ktedonobacteraceae bacterium]|nr:amino acid adenylation domain-containing protein [Ktedonobacteraceae bacterium]
MAQPLSPDPSAQAATLQEQEAPTNTTLQEGLEEDVFALPASFAQQRLWFLEQWEPGVYNVSLAVAMDGHLDSAATEKAFRAIIQRHEALRTTFKMVDADLLQIVAPHMPFTIETMDLRMFPDDVRVMKVRRLISADFQRHFDLQHGPLLRVTILHSRDQRYILILSMHHIVSDGWSMEVLLNEFKTFYTAYVTHEPAVLPELPIQYADYAIWQRDWLQGEVLDEQIDYWRQQLADLQVLQLPFDHPRPAIQSFRGALRTMVIPADLTTALHALNRRVGVTLFMSLLAAFQTLLFRYTDQNSIPIGTPIAGRNDSKLEPLIGCFINTLVICTDVSGNPTFWELLERVREVALGAYEHQDIPFEKLVEMLQPGRDLSHNPLTQVMFTLQNVPQREATLPGVRLDHLDILEHAMQNKLGSNTRSAQQHLAMAENKTAMFDLDMTIWERGDILFGEIKYNTDLFDPETIDRFHTQFLMLLKNIVADPHQHISSLPLLPEDERALVLETWNHIQDQPIVSGSFIEDFQQQVARTPLALAVSDDQQQLTYQELDTQSTHLAAHLHQQGIQPEQSVGLYCQRSTLWAVAVLALFKVGGVYLPLDPQHPPARLHSILQQSQCTLLLSSAHLTGQLNTASGALAIPILSLETLLATEPRAPLKATTLLTPEQLAYIIFTSGSTGQPKGAMVEHRGMRNHLFAKVTALALDEHDIVAQTASQCFDISVWQLLAPLLVGAQIRIYPEWLVADPEAILHRFQQDQISILEGVPSWVRALLEVQARYAEAVKLPQLRWIIPTGEALQIDLCERWLQYYPAIPLLNAYGPTECSDDVTHQEIREMTDLEMWSAQVPIGYAVPNLSLYVLDKWQQPQPIGVWGELYVGGVGVGRGYIGNPQRTAEAFVPHPWSTQPGARLYRTGDVGRYRADGSLEFLGRIDQQVKLRGYRIELGEIEQVLRRQPGIHESIVIVKTDAQRSERLIGYVVIAEGHPFSQEQMQHSLREQLPEYMIPGVIVPLQSLPVMISGKVDRQALPEPHLPDATHHDDALAPRTPLEKQLAAIWSEVLGVDHVSIHDDFFTSGGHSLLTVRLMMLIEQHIGKRLPLAAIFQGRTIEALAELLSRHSESALSSMSNDTQLPSVDLQAEATLGLDVCPEIWADQPPVAPANILLTGATGFLGTFLLAELLQHTGATIYCLVRSRDVERGRQILQQRLEEAFLWQPAYRSRIVPVPGDLEQPLLGLSEQNFNVLARELDTIYHNGALVTMLAPYQQLKAANVDGTREIIRLAATHRIKSLHYISTLSVLPNKEQARIQYVREKEALDDYHEYVRGGYDQSKWVAEKIVTIARSRGLPVTIYRPGRITGDSQTGVWRSNDIICHMIKACIQLGKRPVLSEKETLELVPVEYVSQAVVALSLRKTSLGQAFHLCDPAGTRVNDLTQWIGDFGYTLEPVEYATWLQELATFTSTHTDHGLSPFLSLFLQPAQEHSSNNQATRIIHDNRHTLMALARMKIPTPITNAQILHTYLAYMVKNAFLHAPSHSNGYRADAV